MDKAFRLDINGLRGWAVLIVLLFHFGVAGFDGGFVGVDIFFVISGFLMARIICRGLQQNNFSYLAFFFARARRILPALMALIAVLLLLGWFQLPTSHYQQLGTQIIYSLLFLSNEHFLSTTQYFGDAAADKWLLHTWSLSIEWQFYLLLPLILMVLWRIKPRISTWVVGLLVLVIMSFVACIWVNETAPTTAYYLLTTRSWEMLVGSIVYLLQQRDGFSPRWQRCFEWLGWTLFFISAFLLSGDLAWPSSWTVLPVLSASLILLANNQTNPLITHPVWQWLGHRSYSIYLWHWPVVVAFRFVGIMQTGMALIASLLITAVLAELSYQLVELRSRHWTAAWNSKQYFRRFGSVIGILMLASIAARFIYFEGRISQDVELADFGAINRNPTQSRCFDTATADGGPACVYGNPGNITAAVIGDSHANSLITAIGDSAENNGQGVLFYGMSNCPTLSGVKYTKASGLDTNSCDHFNRWALDEISQLASNVALIIVNRTTSYVEGPNEEDRIHEPPEIYFTQEPDEWGETAFKREFNQAMLDVICDVAKDRPVYLMQPIPELIVNVPRVAVRSLLFGRPSTPQVTLPLEAYYQRHKFVLQVQRVAETECDLEVLSPLPFMCDDEDCFGTDDGQPLYSDDDHLNEFGNKRLIPMFDAVFERNHAEQAR